MLGRRDIKDLKISSSFSSTIHPTLVTTQTPKNRRNLIYISAISQFYSSYLLLFEWKLKDNLSVSIFTLKKAGRKLWNWKMIRTHTHDFAHIYFLIQMIYLCWQTYLHILLMPATWNFLFHEHKHNMCKVKGAMKSCWLKDDIADNGGREERLSDKGEKYRKNINVE